MNTNTSHTAPYTPPYWGMLKSLSNEEKEILITLLSSSMKKKAPAEKNSPDWATRYVGVWKDDRTAEDIMSEIRSMRTDNNFEEML